MADTMSEEDELLMLLIARMKPACLLDLHWIGAADPDSAAATDAIMSGPMPAQEKYRTIFSLLEGTFS